MAYLKGPDAAMQTLRAAPFNTAGNYSFSVVPLFVLMGILAFYTKISTDLYNSAYKWVGSLHGGLAMSTVGACAGFAAICGESLAASLTMGTTALPEMKRFNYAPGLAAGSVAVGGTLGVLIPPSLVFILYALLADQSVGELFIAGILPGIILTILLMGYIYIRCRITPAMGPPAPSVRLFDKVASTWQVWPVVVVFVLVIGGIYGGFFTPTEAGAVGAFTMLVTGLFKRRLNMRDFIKALRSSMNLVAMGFTILIGANIFGYFLAVSKVPIFMASYVASLPLTPIWIMIIILLIYLFLGCLMPAIPMVILTVPIFFPSVKALGFDPIWFGVITALMFEAAVITPPVGINVFGLAGVDKDIPMETIFKGVLPFMICIFLCIALLIAFPSIVTFLPQVLR
jgi:tripartite ATP-independent transporter DctM subunit